MKFHFDGETFRAGFDYDRLKSGIQRIFWILLDGKWHGTMELRELVMPSADSRVRDLRKAWYGTMEIEEDPDPETGMGRYRLDLASVEEVWARRILGGDIKVPKGKKLPTDPDEMRDLLLIAVEDLIALDEIKHAHNTYRSIQKKIKSHKTPDPKGAPPPNHADLDENSDPDEDALTFAQVCYDSDRGEELLDELGV